MSYPQAPQHERNQQFHQSLSLDNMMMQVMEIVPESWRTCNEIQNFDLTLPALKDVQTSFDRNSVSLQRKIDQAELGSTQPTFHPEEDVRDDTLTNLEVREDTEPEDYVIEISEECEVFQIELEIVIALNEGEDEMKIDVEVCEICGDYSHSAHNCPYHPQYENYHYSSHISPQPDFSGFMSYPQAPQHERNQQFHQSLSLDNMMMQVMEIVHESWRTCNEIQNFDLTLPTLKDVQTSFDRNSVSLQRKIDQAELGSTQPTFHPEEDMRDDTLTNLEVREDTEPEDYVIEISEECEVFQIEPEIVIALNEGEDEMKIDVD
ncbi:hypothetical protein Scep_026429 [Stephania cephalantha]|uniref:Uncharacterized protein n=1 Tax=Stephania cephalantha TaxID=152367 RepID=A0AAP0EK40_9MAGN